MKYTQEKLRVMLVDDHRVLNEGMTTLLNATGDMRVCGTAGNLEEAFAVFKKANPDVVLLDLNLGANQSGFTFLEKIKPTSPRVRVIVVSTFDDETFRGHARLLGADDYIAKGASFNEIVSAIRHVVRADPVRPGAAMPSQTSVQERRSALFNSLSGNEKRVVELLLEGRSQKEIGAEIGITPSTVGTYVQRARDKFGAKSVAHLVSIIESVIPEVK